MFFVFFFGWPNGKTSLPKNSLIGPQQKSLGLRDEKGSSIYNTHDDDDDDEDDGHEGDGHDDAERQ